MSNQIILKKSSVATKVPQSGDLAYGEVALNYADGKLYFKNSSNTIQPLGIAYTKVISNTNAQINQGYIANTGAGSFTITLPASPQTGNYVIIVDDGNFNTNPLYVGRNGQPIVGTAADLTLDIQGVSVTLLYDGGQWNVYTQVGASGGSGSGTEGQEYDYYSFPSAIVPDTNNTYALGNANYGWQKLWFGDGTGQTTAAIADGTSITNTGGNITAQAGGLAGTTLKSTVVNSSLTSVGTITSGVWHGSAIANAYLANSSVTIGTTSISLGSSSTTLTGLTSVTSTTFVGTLTGNASTVTNGVYTTDVGTVTNTMLAGSISTSKITGLAASATTDTTNAANISSGTLPNARLSSIPNTALANSSVTIGTTGISLGGSSTTLAGLTSVTSTSFIGALTGNASTATTLATARNINGVAFNGSADITITAANPNALTIGTGLSGTSYTGSSSVTIAIDSTVVTLTGTQTLSNKTLTTPSITGATTITYTPGSTTGVALTTTGKDTQGGTGYFDFFKATNTTSGGTNGSKTFRLNSTGSFEVINSAYSATIAALTDSGNLSTAGTITAGAYTAGQVIKDTMLDNTQFTVNTTTVATSNSDTDFITYSYTPVSSSSYLIIHVHVASYDAGIAGGTGNDSYFSRIKVDGAEITYSRQATRDTYTFRSGTLFPLTGRYTNSNTTAKTITVGVRRDSADDSITITNSSTALWMRITEIAR